MGAEVTDIGTELEYLRYLKGIYEDFIEWVEDEHGITMEDFETEKELE